MAVLRALVAAAVCSLLARHDIAGAQTVPPPTEYAVKAAYLYNFAKFVEWPAEKPHEDRFVIAILGDDPFGPTLERTLQDKKIGGRDIAIRRITGVDEVSGADLLFICDSERARLQLILKRVQGAAVLTVAQVDDFVARGGMLGFQMKDNLVRFDVNVDQVHAAGLKMSSQLIRVARRVVSSAGRS